MINNRLYNFSRAACLITAIFIISCANFKAYFNTFYNAENYFEKAEKSRLENRGDALPKIAKDDYEKVIEKTQTTLENFPEFDRRKSAYLMMIQSQFYLAKYRDANQSLSEMNNELKDDARDDGMFWAAMIKWKEDKAQPAINDLKSLLLNNLHVEMEAKVHMSIAEIYFDQQMKSPSMDHLEKAAQIIRDPIEKGQIYYRIADLSFRDKDYERALSAYQQVIKLSQTKKQIQESHLRSVQIYRLQGKLDLATRTIKNMLLDENYSTIFSDLELELGKLYQQQGLHADAKNRLESIVQDYQRTLASAEAYYLLGQLSISQDWDLKSALKQFEMVAKEHKSSLYISPAKSRLKEINAYLKVHSEYGPWMERIAQVDSLGNSTMTSDDHIGLSTVLYGLAELEMFHFGRSDSGIIYLNQLITFAPNAPLIPKALYAKSAILSEMGEDSTVKVLRTRIVNEYPKTDYAMAVIRSDSTYSTETSNSDDQLVLAEDKWKENPVLAMDSYKEIVSSDTVSEASVKAAYFLAHQYDYQFIRPDSAKKYYEWVLKYHQGSEQANQAQKRVVLLNMVLADTTVQNAN